ncbi:MAG: nuclease A inhibitor family protein, partial [Cyanobacteria bacterium P01_D01_bin.44]
MPTADNVIPQLKAACEGLMWRSEADYPLNVICWELPERHLDYHDLLYYSGHAVDTQVAAVSLDSFFGKVTVERAWFDSQEKALVQRYRSLRELLELTLQDLKVYRMGEVEVDVCVLGWTEDHCLVGVAT